MTAPSRGIAPGWRVIIDAEEPDGPLVVVDRSEMRVVQYVYDLPKIQDGVVFACLERQMHFIDFTGYRFSEKLEFDLRGWTTTYQDAEAWLRGEQPETFIVERLHG